MISSFLSFRRPDFPNFLWRRPPPTLPPILALMSFSYLSPFPPLQDESAKLTSLGLMPAEFCTSTSTAPRGPHENQRSFLDLRAGLKEAGIFL